MKPFGEALRLLRRQFEFEDAMRHPSGIRVVDECGIYALREQLKHDHRLRDTTNWSETGINAVDRVSSRRARFLARPDDVTRFRRCAPGVEPTA